MGRRYWQCRVGCALTVLALCGAAASASAAPVFAPFPVRVALPASAQFPAYLLGVGCVSGANCAAAGFYPDSFGVGFDTHDTAAVVASETAGVWGTATVVTLPPDASKEPSAPQEARVDGATCTGPGDCLAVGTYFGDSYVMVVPESNGSWGQARGLALPANANTSIQEVNLNSISCTSQGNCVAAGYYRTNASSRLIAPMVISETNGVWGRAVEVTPPSGSTESYLYGISCPAAGACVAVGQSAGASGNDLPLVVTQHPGGWVASTRSLPAGASTSQQSASLNSVGCAAPGNCVAGGDYTTSGGLRPMLVTATGGNFGNAIAFPLPGDAASTSQTASVQSVSCPAAGQCVLVGSYTDGLGQSQGMLAEQSGGTWGAPVYAGEPTDQANFYQRAAALLGVSCPDPGECSAVGYYTDSAVHVVPMTLAGLPPLAVTTTALPTGTVGRPYSAQLAATGGTGHYTWAPDTFNLPAGLTLNLATGVVSGVPTTPGTANWTVIVRDAGPPAQERLATFAVTIAPAPPQAPRQPPVLSRVKVKPAVFVRAGQRHGRRCVAKPAHARHPKHGRNSRPRSCRRPVRITISYTLSRDARVTATVTKQSIGRKIRARCVAATRHNSHHPRCTRWVRIKGTLQMPGHRGSDRYVFDGRIGHHTLGRGTYRLRLTPVAGAVRGRSVTVTARIR